MIKAPRSVDAAEEEVMFISVKRLLIAATATATLSAPSVADVSQPDGSAGSSASGQAQRLTVPLLLTAERQLRRGQLRAAAAQPFASQDGSSTTATRVGAAGPSSRDWFRWRDAGVGAAGPLTLVVIGFSATFVIRRRARRPLAS
jgi:hypothetical protein